MYGQVQKQKAVWPATGRTSLFCVLQDSISNAIKCSDTALFAHKSPHYGEVCEVVNTIEILSKIIIATVEENETLISK